jgi:hypothetical protein
LLCGCALACASQDHEIDWPVGPPVSEPASGDGTAGVMATGAAGARGIWQLFGWEDPIAVELDVRSAPSESVYTITGRGCDAGYEALVDASACIELCNCDSVSGQGQGTTIDFSIHFDDPPRSYVVRAHRSKDGTRMAGAFYLDGAPPSLINATIGWSRVELDGGRASQSLGLTGVPDIVVEAWSNILKAHAFRLQGDVAVGAIVPGRAYSLRGYRAFEVTSALGVFSGPDWRWDAAAHTLTAGPVPETIPGMPVALRLRLSDDAQTVLEVRVTGPDSTQGTLLPVD